jgi:hypothetical protein
MNQTGHLEKVDLRDIWKTEAGDFTPWLGTAENIQLLGDTVRLPGQRGREVWLMKTQYLGEEVMIPCGLLLLSFDAVIFRMVLEQCDGHSS